jgi:hypothetical protein
MKKTNRVGETLFNNFGSEMEIVEYRGNGDIDVFFAEYNWTARNVQYGQFIKGTLKCPYERRLRGVGYMGDGHYKSKENGKLTKAYVAWKGMMERCYSEEYLTQHPTYRGCTVCEEWQNFQTFCKWFDDNYYEIEGQVMNLDKDIMVRGNKEYGPETCIFVPQEINLLFTKSDATRGEYPVGVYYHTGKKKYVAQCNTYKKRKHIGYYNSVQDAFLAYKDFKEAYVKKVANDYIEDIPYSLYEAMMEYTVEIGD